MFYVLSLNRFLFLLIILITSLYGNDIELTVLVPASQRECFHQIFETNQTVETEYEVLAGGDADINYWFYSPTNRVLQSDSKQHDGHHTLLLEETGEYRFCFDNSFSRFSQKQVYFSIRTMNAYGPIDVTQSWMNLTIKDELGDLQNKIQEIRVRKKNTILFLIKIREQ